jgi:hypothetical protein
MDPDTAQRFLELEVKLDAVYTSAEKTRKYIQWTLIASITIFVIPLIVMMFVLPAAISSITSTYSVGI